MIFFYEYQKQIILMIVFLTILLGMIFLTNSLLRQKTAQNSLPPSSSPTPASKATEINPSYKNNTFIPTYSPEKGSGVDIEAPLVAQSMQEIEKLNNSLPYEQTLTTPSSQEITIVIPDKTSQTNPWTLQINVFGLDYQIAKEDPEYQLSRESMMYVASFINKWIKEKGGDPVKIMIIWGDQIDVQNKSQEWLGF